MATPSGIRSGLRTRLIGTFPDVQVTDYVLGNPTSPGFEIDMDPEGVNYDLSMGRGSDEWWFIVRGFVAESHDIGAQRRRDEWLASSGATSVKAAIEGDKTLGGNATDVRVVSGVPRSFTAPAAPNTVYAAAEWRVRVLATG